MVVTTLSTTLLHNICLASMDPIYCSTLSSHINYDLTFPRSLSLLLSSAGMPPSAKPAHAHALCPVPGPSWYPSFSFHPLPLLFVHHFTLIVVSCHVSTSVSLPACPLMFHATPLMTVIRRSPLTVFANVSSTPT